MMFIARVGTIVVGPMSAPPWTATGPVIFASRRPSVPTAVNAPSATSNFTPPKA
jgi:hypothetical protein